MFIFVLIRCITPVPAQAFSIGHTTINFSDTVRSRSIQTELYYPSDADGENVSFTQQTTDAFPVLVFGHGFLMSWDAYRNLWEALVSQGYIMAFPVTETGFTPSHDELGKDLAFLANRIREECNDVLSLFYQRVDSAVCVMGHSMGGGASFLAASQSSAFTAIANLSAAETNPSAIAAASTISLPALLFAGENDCVTPPATNQQLMYDALASTCKTLVTIHGGSHCQMAESNVFCNLGESSCSPAPAISRAEQHDIINRFILPWLDFYLKGNCQSGSAFDSLVNADTAVTVQGNCQLCISTTSTEISPMQKLTFFPNPVSQDLLIHWRNESLDAYVQVEVFDVYGRMILDQKVPSGPILQVSFRGMAEGIYHVQAKDERGRYSGTVFHFN